jgi:UDP-N-acetylmuramoylalanine--D-glutamate ligase
LSKGIDRGRLVGTLTGRVSFVACFGAEAVQLQAYCVRHGIAAHVYATLEDAFNDVVRRVQSGEPVLFSPAGSSFDLFANYQERGERFKQLVHQYCDTFGRTIS